MTIALADVLDLKAGTLIKGLKVNQTGAVSFSLNGWFFEQRKLIRTVWSSIDRNQFSFTYYKGNKVEEHVKNSKIKLLNPEEGVDFASIKRNGRYFLRDLQSSFTQEVIDEGECVGMSMGKNFMAVQPSHYDVYRADYFEVYLFHKILHENENKWVAMHSKRVNKQLLLWGNKLKLLDIDLELI